MNFKKMTFLCMQKLTNFPYIEADFDALTNYELLCKVVEYLNKVIANENAQNEAINELATAFNNLKEYVDNFFDNLDVQEEINNKLDEMAESGELTDIIAQYLGLAGMIAFDTVADMKLAENLVNGSKCQTLGFHSINDGGGSYYKIRNITNDDVVDEMTIIAVYNNNLIAELIYDNEINVKQFGAYGDNTHDDTLSLNTAFSKGITVGKNVFIPSGTYLTSSTLNVYGSYNLDTNGIKISGDERGNTTIKANSTIENMIEITSSGDHARRVNIANITLNGNNNANKGIYTNITVSESKFYNVKIYDCADYGFYSYNKAFYLTNLEKCVVYNSGHGFYIYGGTNTSINLTDCYCYNCETAYKVSGIYNLMNNCCADGSETDIVFDLALYRGTIVSPGSEAYNATNMFVGDNKTNVVIIGAYTWGNDTDEDAIHVNVNNGRFTFIGGAILFDRSESDKTMPGYLYKKGAYGIIKFYNTRYAKYNKSENNITFNYSTAVNIVEENSNVNIRYDDKLAFLGTDGRLNTGIANSKDLANPIPSNAIFFGLGDNVKVRSDGVSVQTTGLNSKGDILLSRNPENIGGIGWIQSSDHTLPQSGVTWQNGVYYKIPVVYAETTENRMSTPVRGQMMFDRTLGKPIWYNGTNWVDATGTQV